MIGEIHSIRQKPTALSVVLYSLICWLLALLQVGFLNRLPLFDAPIELLLAAVCLIGWKKGSVTGAVVGVVGGYTLDALTVVGVSYSPLLFALAGIWMGVMARRLFDHILTYLLAVLPAMSCLAVLRALSTARFFTHAFAVLLGGGIASVLLYLPSVIRRIRQRKG